MRNYGRMVMAIATIISAVVCFAVSLEVGDRREQVQSLKRQIARDVKEMRRLQAEWQIRVRPAQLQRLNDSYFGLTAPTADRYFASADAYVAFAADGDSVPQEPQIMPAIENGTEPQPAPRTYLAHAGEGEGRVLTLASDGPAVAMQAPPAPRYRPRPSSGFGSSTPNVHMASWSDGPVNAMPRAAAHTASRSDAPARIQLASWTPEPLPVEARVAPSVSSAARSAPRKAAAEPAAAKAVTVKAAVAEAPVAKATKPKVEVAQAEQRPVAAEKTARSRPAGSGAGRLGGLDSSTIASIEQLATVEGTQ